MTGDKTIPQTLTIVDDPVGLAEKVSPLTERQIVQGTVVRVDNEGVLVDVGAKSEGLIPSAEMSREGSAADVAVGDRIDVMVVRVEGEEGNITLSKRRADFEIAWRLRRSGRRERASCWLRCRREWSSRAR